MATPGYNVSPTLPAWDSYLGDLARADWKKNVLTSDGSIITKFPSLKCFSHKANYDLSKAREVVKNRLLESAKVNISPDVFNARAVAVLVPAAEKMNKLIEKVGDSTITPLTMYEIMKEVLLPPPAQEPPVQEAVQPQNGVHRKKRMNAADRALIEGEAFKKTGRYSIHTK